MILSRTLASAVLVQLCLASCLFADSIQENLQAAKKKHEEAVATAKETLSKAFLARIKDAAQKEDLATIKEVIAEKESFESSDALPTHLTLTEDVIRYIGARRASASATYLVYQNSIQAYAAKNQVDIANKLESESKRFTENESKAVSLTKPKS